MVSPREITMRNFQPVLPSKEFYATAFGKAKTLVLFGGLAALFAWMAWQLRDPEFLSQTSSSKLAAIRDLFHLFPAEVAIMVFSLLAAICLYAMFKTIMRMRSALPELILSEAGINAYPNLRANQHGFLSWDDLASVSTYNGSVMIFYGKRASFMGKRTVLAVNLSEIGVAKKEMDALLESFVAAGNLARNSGRAPVDFVYPTLPDKARVAPAQALTSRPAMPQPVQRPFGTASAGPDFGRRMTRI
jgi:hypothetical protein